MAPFKKTICFKRGPQRTTIKRNLVQIADRDLKLSLEAIDNVICNRVQIKTKRLTKYDINERHRLFCSKREPVFWQTLNISTQTELQFNCVGRYTSTLNITNNYLPEMDETLKVDAFIPIDLNPAGKNQAILLPPKASILPFVHGQGTTEREAITKATENVSKFLSLCTTGKFPRTHPGRVMFIHGDIYSKIYMGD